MDKLTQGEIRVMAKKLSPYEQWMVKSNLEHAKTQGIESILAILRSGGYNRVADAVQEAHEKEVAKNS